MATRVFRPPERSPLNRCWESANRPSRDPERGLAALAHQGELAVREDGAECILLGCAGFVDFVEDLSQKLGVPVLDGVMPAVKFAEAMVDMRLTTSKVSTWGYPENKEIVGLPMFTKEDLTF